MKHQEKYWRVAPTLLYRGWDDSTKLLALYLMCNRNRTAEGLYVLPKVLIRHELNWSPQKLTTPFGRLLDAGFILYDETVDVVLLSEALQTQNTANPNMRKHAVRKLRALPFTFLFDPLLELAMDYDPPLAEEMVFELPERFSDEVLRLYERSQENEGARGEPR